MLKKLGLISGGLLLIVVVFAAWPRPRTRACFLAERFTISTVEHGEFIESIPLTGTLTDKKIITNIDKHYGKIKVGLKGTSPEGDVIVVGVDTTIRDGQYTATLEYQDPKQPTLKDGSRVRLRINLSDPIQTTMVSVGGFHRDTGGQWILVLINEDLIIKRFIRLGKRNPDYFEVVAGLLPGERV